MTCVLKTYVVGTAVAVPPKSMKVSLINVFSWMIDLKEMTIYNANINVLVTLILLIQTSVRPSLS